MDDLISRQAVWDVMQELWGTSGELLDRLMALPSVTPAEKVGRWKPYDGSWYECSECGAIREAVGYFENFCPNCGAKMEQYGSSSGTDNP